LSILGPRLLNKDLAQAGLAERVVLEVKLVEAVKDGLVGVHVQRVDIQVIPGELQRLKYLSGTKSSTGSNVLSSRTEAMPTNAVPLHERGKADAHATAGDAPTVETLCNTPLHECPVATANSQTAAHRANKLGSLGMHQQQGECPAAKVAVQHVEPDSLTYLAVQQQLRQCCPGAADASNPLAL
jgi:hypothetical protein